MIKVDPRTKEGALLKRVVSFYLDSGDFNGLPVSIAHGTNVDIRAAARLIRKGFVEVIGSHDYPNPHIRPWASRRSEADQIESLTEAIQPGAFAVCLYPTIKALTDLDPSPLAGRPYELRRAHGAGALEPVFFRPDVIEPYREDPRFAFRLDDVGFQFSIRDEAYDDESEPDSEKVSLIHGGLAYNFGSSDEDGLKRAVAVWYTDLADLTPEMQRRWETYEIPDQEVFDPHPSWIQSQIMGEFPDGPGPFDRFFGEIETINSIYEMAMGEQLFRITDRPEEFGWLLRPSKREFNHFVLQLDKLLSDNLNHRALDLLGAPKQDDDGKALGSLNRLEKALQIRSSFSDEQIRDLMRPLRKVWKLRQVPAHATKPNEQDVSLIEEQIDLLNDVVGSLFILRRLLQTLSAASDFDPPSYLNEGKYYRV